MARATFSNLPPEMVDDVFAFVRSKADQAAVCLVSRAWRTSMAPIMWEIFKTDLCTASPKSLATLLHPASGILNHVRDLDIRGTNEGEDRLRLVIAAMPRDRVRSFSTSFELTTLTWQLLLPSQRKIEDLDVCGIFTTPSHSESSDLDSNEHHAWMGSLLPEVSSILLELLPNEALNERIFNGIKSVSRYCPKLNDLMLYTPADYDRGAAFLSALFSYANELPPFENLTALQLYHMNIATPGDQTLCKCFNLSKLSSLEIGGCDYLVPFLEGLISFYANSTGGLNQLAIILPERLEEPRETILAIQKLLGVCPKLRALLVNLEHHGFITKDSVLAHCQTLISLRISTGFSESVKHFSLTAMKSILEACTKLKRLAVNMPRLSPGYKSQLGAGVCLDGEFAKMLTLISANHAIQTLRIFDLPNIEVDDDGGEIFPSKRDVSVCQVLMQNHANNVLRFMAKQGSNLKVLSFKPSYREDLDERELVRDGNGHRWPEYNYVRGRTTDITGATVVVAHPMKDISLEFPDMTTFLSYI